MGITDSLVRSWVRLDAGNLGSPLTELFRSPSNLFEITKIGEGEIILLDLDQNV